jgi:proton glutamate symport protein
MPKLSLTVWILIATAAGIAVGALAPDTAVQLSVVSNVFIRLIKSIIAPLLFASLVAGIGHSGSAGTMGRVGARSMGWFLFATSLALVVGLVMVNVVRPGDGLTLPIAAATPDLPTHKITFAETVEKMFPKSVVDAMGTGDVLQIVLFSVLFGVSCVLVGEKAKPVLALADAVLEVMFKYTELVVKLAPLGAGAAIAATVGKNGLGALVGLLKLVLTLYAALIVFVVCVLVPAAYLGGVPLRRFAQAIGKPWLLAFSTASSEAALPQALDRLERFGVPKYIVSFVLPLGYSFNLDGSTLYLALASVFVSQAAGIELDLITQIQMMLTLMLTSKGVAAVPRASLVILTGTLATFGLPMEGIALILGVDAFMDMARTSVNLLGNGLAAALVARWEGVTFPTDDFPEEAAPRA